MANIISGLTGTTKFAWYIGDGESSTSDGYIYVDDGAKSAKGGFGDGKGPSQEYFVVSSDSIRAYLYDDPLVQRA